VIEEVEKIDVDGRDNPEGYTCTVHFSDKQTNIEVVVFSKEIIVREALPDISDRLTCWYDYECPLPSRDLVLTKRKCKLMAPIFLGPLRRLSSNRRNMIGVGAAVSAFLGRTLFPGPSAHASPREIVRLLHFLAVRVLSFPLFGKSSTHRQGRAQRLIRRISEMFRCLTTSRASPLPAE
jgi:hypothetical protein